MVGFFIVGLLWSQNIIILLASINIWLRWSLRYLINSTTNRFRSSPSDS